MSLFRYISNQQVRRFCQLQKSRVIVLQHKGGVTQLAEGLHQIGSVGIVVIDEQEHDTPPIHCRTDVS